MEPMTILMSALSVAGAASQPIADQAIKDGYAGLKALLLRKFGGNSPKLHSTLDDYADDPDTYEKQAAEVVKDVGADRDQEMVDKAAELLKQSE